MQHAELLISRMIAMNAVAGCRKDTDIGEATYGAAAKATIDAIDEVTRIAVAMAMRNPINNNSLVHDAVMAAVQYVKII